jgi:HD-GYP domain-containing protein (c-di-GMP phosphodiesterase class II)
MVVAPDDGAAEGEEVEGPLGVLAMIVRDRLRSSDVACRLSTNRLGVLLPEAGGMQGVIVADRIRSAARGLPSLEGVESVSIGIAAFPGQAATASELIAAASRALHMARMHGGDRTFLYERAIASELERSLSADRDHDESVLATLIAICADLEQSDGLGLGHCESVGRIAALIARRLGLSGDQAEDLRLAGAVHDLGMIGVSREALSKPGPLSPDEWEEVRSHPEVGSRMLAGTPIERLGPWLMHHHERYDGDGYPGGLAGEDIPFEARILAVAEAYDAMTRDRAYAAALDQRSAVQELRRGAGHQFDPAVAEVLIDLVEAGTVRAPSEDGERL